VKVFLHHHPKTKKVESQYRFFQLPPQTVENFRDRVKFNRKSMSKIYSQKCRNRRIFIARTSHSVTQGFRKRLALSRKMKSVKQLSVRCTRGRPLCLQSRQKIVASFPKITFICQVAERIKRNQFKLIYCKCNSGDCLYCPSLTINLPSHSNTTGLKMTCVCCTKTF